MVVKRGAAHRWRNGLGTRIVVDTQPRIYAVAANIGLIGTQDNPAAQDRLLTQADARMYAQKRAAAHTVCE
jgi:hypothetical protein